MAGETQFTFTFDAKNNVTTVVKQLGDDVDKVKNKIDETNTALSKTSKSAGLFGGTLSDSLKQLTTGYAAVAASAAGVLGVIYKGIEAASEQEAATEALNSALKINGNFSESAANDFANFANTLQKTTVVADEAALSALALAKNFGATNEQAKQIVKVAADMSAALGISLDTAVTQLSGTLNGSIGKFGKINSEVKGLSQSALESGEAIEILGKQFEGTAQSKLNTYSGSLAALKNSFGEVLEEIGNFVIKNEKLSESFAVATKFFEAAAGGLKGFREELTRTKEQQDELNKSSSAEESQRSLIEDQVNNIDRFYQFEIAQNKKKQKQLFEDAQSRYDLEVQAAKDAAEKNEKIAEINSKKLLEIQKSLKPEYDALQKTLSPVGLTPIEVLEDGAKKQKQTLLKALKAGLADQKTYASLSEKVDQKLFDDKFKNIRDSVEKEKKANEEREKNARESAERLDKINKAFEENGRFAVANPFEAIQKGPKIPELTQSEKLKFQEQLDLAVTVNLAGIGVGFTKEILKGAEGAKNIIAQGAGLFANALLPGLGPVVTELVGVLAQGPDAIRDMVKQFVDSIPIILENVLLALPALIQALVEGFDRLILNIISRAGEIVTALVLGITRAIPSVATTLALEMPRVAIALANEMPGAAIKFVGALIGEAPNIVSEIIRGIGDGIANLFKNINPFSSGGGFLGDIVGGIGDVIGDVGDFFGFATGGYVPPGYPNDTFPARLSSDEFVLNNSLTPRLEDFLSQEEAGGVYASSPSADNSALLIRIVQLLESPMQVSSSVDFNQDKLADIILNLSRANRRLFNA